MKSTGVIRLFIYTAIIFVASVIYYVYLLNTLPPTPERETLLSEIGEGFGEVGLWILVFIYVRTALKLLMGKGPMARRILPDYSAPEMTSVLQGLVRWLDKTHVYVGVAGVAVILLHIVLVGLPLDILFFPIVLVLVVWQGCFGLFLSWRYSPRELRKFSYLVHAQLVTGVMIGVFAYFGHLLVDQ